MYHIETILYHRDTCVEQFLLRTMGGQLIPLSVRKRDVLPGANKPYRQTDSPVEAPPELEKNKTEVV